MRFTTFATSCIAAATFPGLALATPLNNLPGTVPNQLSADTLAQSQLDTHTDSEDNFITRTIQYFKQPKTAFFDVKDGEPGSRGVPTRQDELQEAMMDILLEVGEKENLWAGKGSKDQMGWPHDYCSYDKHIVDEVVAITSGLRQKLDKLFLVLHAYNPDKALPVSEADLLEKVKREKYLDNFDAAIESLKKEVELGQHLIERDTDEANVQAKEAKFNRVAKAAQGLTGLHRGELAIPNAWARELIKQSCQRDEQDRQDLYGVMFKGALAAVPQAVGGITKAMGGSDEMANNLTSITDKIAKVTGMGTPEDQKNALNNLADDIGVEPGILSALASNDPKTVQKVSEQVGAKQLDQAIIKLHSGKVKEMLTKMEGSIPKK